MRHGHAARILAAWPFLCGFGSGARRVDIGQGGRTPWVVPADPESNEFRVLRPRKSLVEFAD